MDALRALQLLTDLAYLALGIAALAAALRSHERAHIDVAILFGALALTTGLQELRLLSCVTQAGCVSFPGSDVLTIVLVLILPYALLRLVDDVDNVPDWQMWIALVLLVALAVLLVIAGSQPPPILLLALTAYLVIGTGYAAVAFIRRARATLGITRRRMAAVAWGCGLLAAAIALAVLASVSPTNQPAITPLVRLAALASGICFWVGFFPPNWLSQTWRLPELLGYLRPERLVGISANDTEKEIVSDAMAIERLCAATAATAGAARVLLIREDHVQKDLYIWGVPTARIPADDPLVSRVLRVSSPIVVNSLTANRLPGALATVFADGSVPRTAIFAPVAGDGHNVGALAIFAEKGPMFVEEDLKIASFFAGEAAAILRMQYYRTSVSELEALREADRLKDEFMAVVSHELRTPLTAITGYSDILLRKLSGPLNERQERQVLGVRDAARRLLALINDLLDVSKLEAGTLELHGAALDPSGAIERAATAVRVIGTNKGVSVLTRDVEPAVGSVWADDERLQQILSNLLMNAIKFTPEGGTVWIGADVGSGPNGPEVVFSVRDTGVGLVPGQESRVWERFYQAESSSTRRFGGAGLGLSIVRRLTELHGGRVEATSGGLNLGSTFSVHLPGIPAQEPHVRAPLPQTATLVSAPQPHAAGRPIVLVVEDDRHIATVLRTYLEADGYRVEIADDGQLAVHMAQALQPFAITLDISLPKLDGWSVLNALKHDAATSNIPVVVVSIVDNRDFGLVLGATEYLVKPIDPDRLRGVLQSLNATRHSGDGSVLIVDDDPALRDVLSSLLAEDGWRVATAADGQAALAAVAHERPSAMVLDLMMPRVDGFEVLQTLREEPTTRDLPVIVVTAKDLTDDDRQRLSSCAERVILKQAMPLEELRHEIRGLLLARRGAGDAV